MEKRLDGKGRWRNRTVSFRTSDEEWDLITILVRISGLTKREYIMRKLTDREIVVQGNPKVYKALKDQMAIILEELRNENHYDHVELCVKKADTEAIHLYEKHGFVDSGYVDESLPDSLNMICFLSGIPKLMLLTPSTVLTPSSFVTFSTARAVSSACVSSVAIVITKQSIKISFRSIP